jgi:hypothetical protein
MSTILAATVGPITAIVTLSAFLVVIALGVSTIRRQHRLFPKGFDRTGWSPERGHAAWFRTKFTWLSGGRG